MHYLVPASVKPGQRKLYIDRGVWAEMILGYCRGAFVPVPWTFPDFQAGLYDPRFAIRNPQSGVEAIRARERSTKN